MDAGRCPDRHSTPATPNIDVRLIPGDASAARGRVWRALHGLRRTGDGSGPSQDDREGNGPPLTLLDGTTVPRLPGFRPGEEGQGVRRRRRDAVTRGEAAMKTITATGQLPPAMRQALDQKV